MRREISGNICLRAFLGPSPTQTRLWGCGPQGAQWSSCVRNSQQSQPCSQLKPALQWGVPGEFLQPAAEWEPQSFDRDSSNVSWKKSPGSLERSHVVLFGAQVLMVSLGILLCSLKFIFNISVWSTWRNCGFPAR